jgi:hypothetical protein
MYGKSRRPWLKMRSTSTEVPTQMLSENKIKIKSVLTWNSMVIKGHSIQVGIDVSVFVPPSKKVFILHVFDLGVKVAREFIELGVSNLTKCR